jgi:cyclic-di-GMP phosphodiesterase TipF (flagellum assembly factor)
MRRISAIFIAVCVVLIAASIGAVLYLGFNVDASTSAIVALSALTGMALVNSVSNRLRDRTDLGDQIADLSRGTADLARQVAEISHRLNAAEIKIASPASRARSGRSVGHRNRRARGLVKRCRNCRFAQLLCRSRVPYRAVW